MTDLAMHRRRFAESLREAEATISDVVVEAFAAVRREQFLGPGPWHVVELADDGTTAYRTTDTAEPIEVYRDILVGIDPARGLNNGEPHSLASWISALAPQPGETVVHVGSGTGYYTAILAELVGRAGRVIAYEVDADLAARATRNLREWEQATVVAANGCDSPTREVNAIFVNCGVTHPAPAWLDALCDGGRLLVPVTASAEASGVGTGAMFMITRENDRFAAAYVSNVGIFPCAGGRSDALNAKLLAKPEASWREVSSIRIEPHSEEPSCWLHAAACLSTLKCS